MMATSLTTLQEKGTGTGITFHFLVSINMPYFCRMCFYYVFVDLIEQDLESFVFWWNHHRIRRTTNTECPAGVPDDLFDLPDMTGSVICYCVDLSAKSDYNSLSGTQDYLCAVDPDLWANAYEDWAVAQPSFYSRDFLTAVDRCLDLLGMSKEDITPEASAVVYKYLVSFLD